MRDHWLRQGALLALLAVVPSLAESIYFRGKISWQSAIPASEIITVEQARGWADEAVWVDARPDEEYAQNHVPGAVSLNEDHWNELLPGLLSVWSPAKKVVVYCSSLSCNASRDVARRLRGEVQLKDSAGKNCVFVLDGGWEAWLKKQ